MRRRFDPEVRRRGKVAHRPATAREQTLAMYIAYTPEQEALRAELRAYFAELMTPEVEAEVARGDTGGPHCLEAVRKMGRDGWLGIGWPNEYGGQGRSLVDQFIFYDESWRALAPIPALTINAIAQTIMAFGSEEQKRFFLPRILRGELHFSVGYTEPQAGTDLASLRTRAVRDGDDWVINGQKIYTSLAGLRGLHLARGPHRPRCPEAQGHLDLRRADHRRRASRTRSSTRWSNPARPTPSTTTCACRVGADRRGQQGLEADHQPAQLRARRDRAAGHGREGLRGHGRAGPREARLADGRRVIDQEWVRMNLARVHARLEFLKLINWKAVTSASVNPGRLERHQGVRHRVLLRGVPAPARGLRLGRRAARRRSDAPLRGRLERAYQGTLFLTFGGGTNEVQRDLIALFGLGMPRVPRH